MTDRAPDTTARPPSQGGEATVCPDCRSPLHGGTSCVACTLGELLLGGDETSRAESESATRANSASPRRLAEAVGTDRTGDTRYTEVRVVGRGGMGEVREVLDRRLGRRLAMKVMRADLASPDALDAVRRFATEARITAQLDHPGVVPVYELGLDGRDRPYFTMKRVDGHELRVLMQSARAGRGGTSLADVVQAIVRLCETLAFAHDRGVVHRDVKSTNVMVGRFGEVYLMDWGIAKRSGEPLDAGGDPVGFLDVRALETAPGQVLGTPCTMPPEQAAGAAAAPAGDVYAMGVLLYELLTGHLPYLERDAQRPAYDVLDALRDGPPTPIVELDPDAPAELVAIAEKAMARDPAARYAGAWELRQDLLSYLDGRVVAAHRTGLGVELRKWVRRHRALTAGVAAAVLVTATAIAAYVSEKSNTARVAVEHAARESAARRRADGQRLAALSGTLLDDEPSVALQLALAAADRAPGDESTTALYAALGRPRERLRLEGHDAYVADATYAHDGSLLVTTEALGLVVVWDARRGDIVRRIPMPGARGWRSCFTRDDTAVLTCAEVGAEATLRRTDVATGRTAWIAPLGTKGRGSIALSPDGSRTAVQLTSGALLVLDTTDGSVRARAAAHVPPPTPRPDVAWAGDDLVVTVGDSGEALAWDASSGALRARLAHDDVPRDAVGAPTPARVFATLRPGIAVVSRSSSVRVWDVARGLVTAHYDLHGAVVRGVSADGTMAVVTDPVERHSFVLDLRTGDVPARLAADVGDGTCAVSPDGRLAAFTDGQGHEIDVWKIDDLDAPPVRLYGHVYSISDLEFSPDGLDLVSAGRDRTVRVWPVAPVVTDARHDGATVIGRAPCAAVTVSTLPGSTDGHVRVVVRDEAQRRVIHELDRELAEGRIAAVITARGDRGVISDAGTSLLVTFDGSAPPVELGPGVRDWQFSRDGRWCAAALPGDGEDLLAVFDGRTGERLFAIPLGEPGARVYSLCSRSGTAVLRRRRGSRVFEVWDVVRGALQARLAGHTGMLCSAVQSEQGDWIVTTAMDRSVRFWDAISGSQTERVDGIEMVTHELLLSPGDAFVAVASRTETVLLRGRSGARMGVIPAGRPIALDPRSRRIVTFGGRQRRDWPVPSRLRVEAARLAVPELDVAAHARFQLDGAEVADARERANVNDVWSVIRLESLGRRWLDSGHLEAAERAFRRAVELRPDRHEAHRGLAAWHASAAARERSVGDAAAAERSVAAAIAALELALASGHSEVGRLLADPALRDVLSDPRAAHLVSAETGSR